MTDESQTPRQAWEHWLAKPMFFLSLLFLVILAGLLHRVPQPEATEFELHVIAWGLGIVWLLLAFEALVGLLLHPADESFYQALGRFLVICLCPPLRIGARSQVRPNHIWLPRLGWQPIDWRLARAVEQFFSIPLMVIAFMVLPLLVIDYHWYDVIRAEARLALLSDVASSIIWLAFAVELTVSMSAAEDKPMYCLRHWVDVLIVVLPFVEVLPAIRMLRMARVLRMEYLGRFGRLYRLRGLAMKAWRSLLLLKVVQRLICRNPEKRLARLKVALAAKQQEVADLQNEIDELTRSQWRVAEGTKMSSEPMSTQFDKPPS